MTAPFSGFKYKTGSDLGEFAKAAVGFAKGSREETDRRRKKALDDALLALKEREAGRQDQELDINKAKEAQRIMENAGNEDQQLEAFNRAGTQQGVENKRADDAAAETRRHNQAGEANDRQRNSAGRPGDLQLRQTATGFEWFRKPGTGGDGPGAGTIPVLAADGQPQVGVPTQAERIAKGMTQSLESTFQKLDDNFKAVNYQAPGMATQVGMDASADPGHGVISSMKRTLANNAVGKFAPEYQQINNSLKSFGSLLVKLMTGAQMSEPEAQRILGIITPVSGDVPATVQQKMDQARIIVTSSKGLQGRALRETIYSAVGEQAPQGFDDPAAANSVPGAQAAPAPTAKKSWKLPNGTVVELE